MRPGAIPLSLLAALLLALALRAAGFEWVFVDGETVVLPPGDAQYHMRRALYGWVNFPEVLFIDPYINFPGGAAISWPPAFDFAVSLLGRLLTGDEHAFQVLAAWVPPALGAAVLLPVYAMARRLGGPATGIGAAFLMAALPMSVRYSRVGQLDHHCAVALVGAGMLWALLRLVDDERARIAPAVAFCGLRIAMLLTWHGSLLYLGLADALLWLAAALLGRRDLLRVQAATALGALVVVAPLVWIFPEPLGGAWSAIALSRIHGVAMAAVAFVSGGLLLVDRQRLPGSDGPAGRIVWTVGLGAFVVAALFVLPATREGLDPALRFLTLRDGVGHQTGEQLPLFAGLGRVTGGPVWQVWGGFGFLLPVLPLAVVWAARPERRRAAWLLAGWCAGFAALAVIQRRYGNDLGPAAAVGFALVLSALSRRIVAALGGPAVAATLASVALALALLAPPVFGAFVPRLASSVRAVVGSPPAVDRGLGSAAGSLTRFLEVVRASTPDTTGFFDTSKQPGYGIVSHANFGHAIQNVARRPTPTDPFWAFIGVENWEAAFGLLNAQSEDRAVELASRLRARYVLTTSNAAPGSFEGWLHRSDGRRTRRHPSTARFRLVTEGPLGGHGFDAFRVGAGDKPTPDAGRAPYKLFELVEGAVLELSGKEGEEVVATADLRTPIGREIAFETRAVVDARGVARLRLPYPAPAPGASSGRATPKASPKRVVASSPWRIHVGDRSLEVRVTEDEVRAGRVVGASDR